MGKPNKKNTFVAENSAYHEKMGKKLFCEIKERF